MIKKAYIIFLLSKCYMLATAIYTSPYYLQLYQFIKKAELAPQRHFWNIFSKKNFALFLHLRLLFI